MSTLITKEDCDRFVASYAVTEEEIARAEGTEQRGQAWHNIRRHPETGRCRLSASNYGAAAEHNEYDPSGTRLLKQMLWPSSFHNEAMDYGTLMEPTVCKITEIAVADTLKRYGYGEVWFDTTGTLIMSKHPWLCASADALVYGTGRRSLEPDDTGRYANEPPLRGVCEFKCPFTKKEFYRKTPHYYYDQFQGQAAIHDVDLIVFSVYTPDATQINYFKRDKKYWNETLFPALRKFFMKKYLPRAIWKERGLLKPGQIDLLPVITLQPRPPVQPQPAVSEPRKRPKRKDPIPTKRRRVARTSDASDSQGEGKGPASTDDP